MEFCPDCGAQIIHAEGCVVCACCGWSMCECSACNGNQENLSFPSGFSGCSEIQPNIKTNFRQEEKDGVYTRTEL